VFEKVDDNVAFMNDLQDFIFDRINPTRQPIGKVLWVPIDEVEPNDYNPNSVAKKEMSLLYTSISHDGYTQPVVTIYDPAKKKYIIVDGFHRYFTARTHSDILERNKGLLPIVVIEKDINERMAATVRHNRARGKHSIDGMSSMVFSMLKNGMTDAEICNELGMEAEELLKLKYITGFAKLFENHEFSPAWESERQMKERNKYYEEHPEEKKFDLQ
jgi:ParB-like chromosome segregation protein Spo0J